jgi:hypothetical protein
LSLSFSFPTNTVPVPLSLPRATSPAHFILCHWITQITFSKLYKPLHSLPYNFLQCSVTSCLMGPNILLNTPLHTLSQHTTLTLHFQTQTVQQHSTLANTTCLCPVPCALHTNYAPPVMYTTHASTHAAPTSVDSSKLQYTTTVSRKNTTTTGTNKTPSPNSLLTNEIIYK